MEHLFAVMRGKLPIGYLRLYDKNEGYLYRYCSLPVCEGNGATYDFLTLSNLKPEVEYESNKLFDFFADRIPPRNRGDFKEFIAMRGMKEFEILEYLKVFKLELATDEIRVEYWGAAEE